jgi:WD repeat-containing protein 23
MHEALTLAPDDRRFCIFSLRFSQDGREILGGANDECLYVYDRECKNRVLKIRCHEDDVNSVAFADDSSKILFSAGDDGLCKVCHFIAKINLLFVKNFLLLMKRFGTEEV